MTVLKGGEKLEAKLREIAKKISGAALVNVGFLEGATYSDGTGVAFVAAMNEFGHRIHTKYGDYYVLPRPFFRGMIAAKSPKWGAGVAEALKRHDYNAREALGDVGEGIRGQLQDSIRQFSSPPLAPSTVAQKGFSKPLVDTGHMLNSVDFEVI